jgi:hypothetical protein
MHEHCRGAGGTTCVYKTYINVMKHSLRCGRVCAKKTSARATTAAGTAKARGAATARSTGGV